MRYPFRLKPSKISETIPTRETMRKYLLAFKEEAPLFLLFLKTVERVQFLEYESDGKLREVIKPVLKIDTHGDKAASSTEVS